MIAEYGEEVGTILGRRYAESFPEAYKEDFSARTASVDLGRLEAIRTDGPHDGGLDLSLYEHLDAGPGEARLKVYRIGVPLSLSEVLPMLSSMGVEVVDERPYELEGLERDVDDLRVRPAVRRAACPAARASCSRTRCGPSGTATTRSTASTGWCSAPG